MCTIALAWRVLADAPVAIAANRDEALHRESLPPRLLDEDPQVVAPQDAEAGGTWLGVSERGLVVAITNRRVGGPPAGDGERDDADALDDFGGERSRGLLVRDALAAGDADDALAFVRESVEEYAYDGFNLLVVDADRATYLEWGVWPSDAEPDSDDERSEASGELRERDLEPGVHVIVNPGLNEADERAVRLREALSVADVPGRAATAGAAPSVDDSAVTGEAGGDAAASTRAEGEGPTEAGAWLYRAAALLGNHDYDVCVHRDGFGTRSSSLVRVGADGTAADAFADGPPCETDYQPVDVPASFLEGSF